jgi:hypothetical protein
MVKKKTNNVQDVLVKTDFNYPVKRLDAIEELDQEIIQWTCGGKDDGVAKLATLIKGKFVFSWVNDRLYPQAVVDLRHLYVMVAAHDLVNGFLTGINILSPGEYQRIRTAGVEITTLGLIRIEPLSLKTLSEEEDTEEGFDPDLKQVAVLARNPHGISIF